MFSSIQWCWPLKHGGSSRQGSRTGFWHAETPKMLGDYLGQLLGEVKIQPETNCWIAQLISSQCNHNCDYKAAFHLHVWVNYLSLLVQSVYGQKNEGLCVCVLSWTLCCESQSTAPHSSLSWAALAQSRPADKGNDLAKK